MLPIFKGLFHLGTDIVTGIDVGAFSTKVVSVRRKNGAKEILYVKEFPVIPYEKFDASLERVAEELSLNAAAKNSRLVLSVPLGNYSYFFLNIPKIPDDELLSAVEWELKKHLTSPVEEYTFDYVIVREFSDENMRKYEVFTVAAPRSDTLKLLNIFKSRKLSVSSITVNPLALVGLTDFLPPSEKNETLVIGSIGFLKTEMVIVINGALRFARVIKLGISQIVSN